jgi:multicomponent Na+:H+ antiporter subunit F
VIALPLAFEAAAPGSSMNSFYLFFAMFLVLNLAGGFLRILRGPTREDRMVAAQLFGTTGVAILLVLSAAGDSGPLRDVALAFVLLAMVNAVVFVRSARSDAAGSAPHSDSTPR